MSRQNYAVPLVGAAALLGGGIYYVRKPSTTSGDASQQIANADKSRPSSDEVADQRKKAADAKRDNGLGGAGIGTNTGATGGAELSTGNRGGSSADRDTPKGPKEKFPSDAGEIGGGPGRANSNTRAIETHGPSMSPGSNTLTGALSGKSNGPSTGGSSSGSGEGIGSKLQGFFTSGSKDREKLRQSPVDTKIASHSPDTPTNRGGSPWDKERRDVTSVNRTKS
ncbi:hypothetical protein CORC01_14326 [Colletotrichum orchidophilum]|uniref:Uncharacterized protein n=1 Tax=Colletotrichum orchidophilum TaxID=1209926 RepID=A0A1G4AMH1_9PEZI|nr:uncharacterized protein CORC01_14326 [Colletotrichum orchidophilum]OHE90378.1 hypothetical protein CORC01_14326 [Colletotrichum orchidophilum]